MVDPITPYTDDNYLGKSPNTRLGDASPQPDVPVTGTNIDPILSVVASILMFGGGYFVSKGWITGSQLAVIVGSIVSVGATIYLAYKNTTQSKIASLANTLNVPKAALARHIVALKRGNF